MWHVIYCTLEWLESGEYPASSSSSSTEKFSHGVEVSTPGTQSVAPAIIHLLCVSLWSSSDRVFTGHLRNRENLVGTSNSIYKKIIYLFPQKNLFLS
jgi:hypothetical protein